MKPRTRRLVRRLSFAALAAVAALAPDAALAQTVGFHVTHAVGRTTATSVEVTGTLQNETRADAVDVSITVVALGANGKSVARGVAYVTPRLPPGATVNFVAKVPAVAGVAGYRTVVSARFVQGVEGP